MKDSKIEWIGQIPDDWKTYMLSQLVKQVKNKNYNLAETNLLSLSYGDIKRKDINSSNGLLPASFDNYNIVNEGDIVLRLTDLQNDHTSLRVGPVKEKGIITSAYVTIRPLDIKNSRFLYYLLHSFDLKKGFYGMGAGVRQGLNYNEVKMLKIILPPAEGKKQITDYLDKKCSEIDSIINESRKTIDEYKEWKKSLIFETVTGKNLDCEKKDSGIEWIGKIPVTWDLIKLKYVCKMYTGNSIKDSEKDNYTDALNAVPYIATKNIDVQNCNIISENLLYIKKGDTTFVHAFPNDTLMCIEGGSAGKKKTYLKKDVCFVNKLCCFHPVRINSKFLFYTLQSESFCEIFNQSISGLIGGVSINKIKNFLIVMPSDELQKNIVEELDNKCSQIDSLITEKEQLIKDLEDYKKSLIYDVVTGKKRG